MTPNSDASLSLRRHDPDQVQRVTAPTAVSQLHTGAPLGTALYNMAENFRVNLMFPVCAE